MAELNTTLQDKSNEHALNPGVQSLSEAITFITQFNTAAAIFSPLATQFIGAVGKLNTLATAQTHIETELTDVRRQLTQIISLINTADHGYSSSPRAGNQWIDR